MSKNGLFWVGLVLLALMAYSFAKKNTELATQLTYSDFLQEVEGGSVRTVRIEGPTVIGEYKTKAGEFNKFKTRIKK